MADPGRPGLRPYVVAGGLGAVVLLLTVARGPVALLAAASIAVLTGFVLAVPPLLRPDGIDWDWLPDRAQEPQPEPGIATLRRLLAPEADDSAAPARLHALVQAIADDRSGGTGYGNGSLSAYLDGPPRRLDLNEAGAVITELEALTTKETR